MPASAVLSELRSKLAALAMPASALDKGHVGLGIAALDSVLMGGLARAALHEIGSQGMVDLPAATAFALAMAVRAAQGRPILWVRQDALDGESGHPHGSGLAELGLDPGRFLFMRVGDAAGVLRAAGEGARCAPLGAVVMQPYAGANVMTLTASRRLALVAEASGVMTLIVRTATAEASAARTRWLVTGRPSRALEGNAPGHPTFAIRLLRHRGGLSEREWHVEWDRERGSFQAMPEPSLVPRLKPKPHVPPVPPLFRPVAAFPADGSAEAHGERVRLRQAE
jgi:protein ImuA